MFSGKYKKISENMKIIEKDGCLDCGTNIDKCSEIAQELTEFSGISYQTSIFSHEDTHGYVIKSRTPNDNIATLCGIYKCIPGIHLTTQECLKFAKKLKELTGRSHDCSGLL